MARAATRTGAAVLLLAGVLALGGCTAGPSEEVRTLRAATGELSAVLLRPEAEQAFEREGHPVEGNLACRSRKRGPDRLVVVCNGSSDDDRELRFRGRIDPATVAAQPKPDEGLPGAFTGKAGGEEVFRMNCFNCEPREVESGAGSSPDAGGGQGD